MQNALELADTGIGLSVLMFFRLIGGAFGVALLTALLVGELNAGAITAPGHAVLGANPGIAPLPLDQAEAINSVLWRAWLISHPARRLHACVLLRNGDFGFRR